MTHAKRLRIGGPGRRQHRRRYCLRARDDPHPICCERAGISYGTRTRRGLRFHDLRHSAATLLLAQGVSQRAVMEILGHSTPQMTQRYMQLPEDAAAAMDRVLRG